MQRLHLLAVLVLICLLSAGPLPSPTVTQAVSTDAWWDTAWPYRIPVTVNGSGVAQVSINFTTALNTLGLNDELLDLRSLRVIPSNNGTPGTPLPYAETYSTMLDDADNPKVGGSSTGVSWSVNDGTASADHARFSQGSGSLKAIVENRPGGYSYPGVELHIASGDPLADWHNYESFIYDVWPEVNASARDQAPDLYYFKLYNTNGCESGSITQGGPPLALDTWNYASVSLKPFDTCTTPNFTSITRMEFHTRDNDSVNGNSGLWDDGDRLTLWFDHLRLVDQDRGSIIWNTDGSTSTYYIYFDVLNHEGHPLPTLATPGTPALTGTADPPEAGGYLHQISGANTGNLAVWAAPPIEKIFKTNAPPAVSAPLRIQSARDEFEPFQLVVRAGSAQNVKVNISDFRKGSDTIAANNVTLHRVDYVPITKLSDHFGRTGSWPDPLYPVAMGATISLPANANQPLWFTVHVPRNAVAGIYQATVTIGTATIPVELEVWDFALPQEIHLAGEWGFGWSSVVDRYKGTVGGDVQECYWDLVDALYEDFADHRLTPKGVGWPAGLNYPGGVEYDCNGKLSPDAWGIWGFGSLAHKYLDGTELDNTTGFPSFVMKGPSSNWPPDSRPSSFCEVSRGTDPPGNAAYNTKWFQYWRAVSGYLGSHPEYAAKGYYHIVNEPQTEEDYDIVAYLAKQTKAAAPNVRILVSEQVEPLIYNNPTYPNAKIDIWMPTISIYEVEKSHDRQLNHGEDVWWYFLYGDRPPLPNPTVMDRTGIEARITPWLAWLERVEGLLYYSLTDWHDDPWTTPWMNNGNGDGFLFYPPKDTTIAFNACNAQSNRLVPSIRWELLREGMEDYEYLWLLNEGDPQIGASNEADDLAQQFIASRTRFSRVPTDLYATRAAIAARLAPPPPGEPTASKQAGQPTVAQNGTFHYTLSYGAGDTAHTVTINDPLPATTRVITATGNKAPTPVLSGQLVNWTVPIASNETITLTIQVEALTTGTISNSATFSGTTILTRSAGILVYGEALYLPLVRR